MMNPKGQEPPAGIVQDDFILERAITDPSLADADLYLNRELSWLAFNERVLGEAIRESNPLLERLKFLTIFASNLDEFFMVRLSGLLKLAERQGLGTATGGRSRIDPHQAEETLDEVTLRVRDDIAKGYEVLHRQILPALAREGLSLEQAGALSIEDQSYLASFFENQVFPILTPLAVDSAHPFPYLSNLSLYLAIHFAETNARGEPFLAFVEIPNQIPRIVMLPRQGQSRRFILLEDVVKLFLSQLFPWSSVTSAHLVRVTRNLDYQLLEGEVQDLMRSIEAELRDREQKFVLRLEVESGIPESLRARLRSELDLDLDDVYEAPRIVGMADLRQILKLEVPSELRDEPFNPRIHPDLGEEKSFFGILQQQDVLLHHPFDSFVSIVEFVEQARLDPDVLAIKMTLYRTGGDSPIIESLLRAVEAGKQVTVVVELKARFDEQTNIVWARRLERAGAHVVFGFVGLKTHCKCMLVVRREGDMLRRYAHLSTGNYNHATARFYTDCGLLTTHPSITQDVVRLFNVLTGFHIMGAKAFAPHGEGSHLRPAFTSAQSQGPLPKFDLVKVAPFGLRDAFLAEIEHETRNHLLAGGGSIILKMNALTDPQIIRALYAASCKGVKVDLIIRGVCVLRPGLPGISENIRVRSIVDRFLEHSRIAWFRNGDVPRIFLLSADFMPRNLDRRVEVAWPILGSAEKERLTEILRMYMGDNMRAHELSPDGSYKPVAIVDERKRFQVQRQLIEQARREGLKSSSYDTLQNDDVKDRYQKIGSTKQSRSEKPSSRRTRR